MKTSKGICLKAFVFLHFICLSISFPSEDPTFVSQSKEKDSESVEIPEDWIEEQPISEGVDTSVEDEEEDTDEDEESEDIPSNKLKVRPMSLPVDENQPKPKKNHPLNLGLGPPGDPAGDAAHAPAPAEDNSDYYGPSEEEATVATTASKKPKEMKSSAIHAKNVSGGPPPPVAETAKSSNQEVPDPKAVGDAPAPASNDGMSGGATPLDMKNFDASKLVGLTSDQIFS